mmetsp:Transcript_11123/g.27330  ORF Transcript_11123/g.27330 Transcript_11123/m.27330 type:complete len:92 (+) Transcript_11123:819-1094(+)
MSSILVKRRNLVDVATSLFSLGGSREFSSKNSFNGFHEIWRNWLLEIDPGVANAQHNKSSNYMNIGLSLQMLLSIYSFVGDVEKFLTDYFF